MVKSVRRKVAVGMAIMMCTFMGATGFVSASSDRAVADYNLVIPRFGLSTNYTDTEVKVGTSSAVNNNTSIGGGYDLNCAIFNTANSQMTKTKSFNSGNRVLLNYNDAASAKGVKCKLGIWSDLTTAVKVQVSGSWSPDDKQ